MSMVYYSSTRLGQQAQRGDWKMLFFSSHIMQRSYSITIIHHTSFSAISTYSRALIVFKGPWSWLLFQPMMMILRFSTRSEASLEPSSSSTCIIWPFTWKRGWGVKLWKKKKKKSGCVCWNSLFSRDYPPLLLVESPPFSTTKIQGSASLYDSSSLCVLCTMWLIHWLALLKVNERMGLG